jgi:hypothetical protein
VVGRRLRAAFVGMVLALAVVLFRAFVSTDRSSPPEVSAGAGRLFGAGFRLRVVVPAAEPSADSGASAIGSGRLNTRADYRGPAGRNPGLLSSNEHLLDVI